MAGTNFENLVFNVRFDSKQRALQEALRVPWHQLEENSAAYAEWHIVLLWVRVISENSGELPDIVRSELRARCPGYLESESRQGDKNRPVWPSLQEWLAAHHFAKPKADGWFNAVMFYAYQDLRTEQAWSLWQRTKAAWHQNPPSRWTDTRRMDGRRPRNADIGARGYGKSARGRGAGEGGPRHSPERRIGVARAASVRALGRLCFQT